MGREQLRHSRLRWSVSAAQFDDIQRAQAIALLEELPWGDLEQELYGLEAALALALEAVGHAIELWERDDEGEERFGDEFALSAEQAASLDDDWRLAYVSRLLYTAAMAYGVSPPGSPGRSADGHVTSPISWSANGSIARLLRGLNDILYGVGSTTDLDPP